jgi:hypothetical protein
VRADEPPPPIVDQLVADAYLAVITQIRCDE